MKILLFIILCSFSFHSNAQQSAVIKGGLKDKLDGKPIPNAAVTILLDSITYSAITQQRGFFILECPKSAKYSIKVEHELYNDYEDNEIHLGIKTGTDYYIQYDLLNLSVSKREF